MSLLDEPIVIRTTEELQDLVLKLQIAAEEADGKYRRRPECCGKPMDKGGHRGTGYRCWDCRRCGNRYRRIGEETENKYRFTTEISHERPVCCGQVVKVGKVDRPYWRCKSCAKHWRRR